jgi:hypothetical protein
MRKLLPLMLLTSFIGGSAFAQTARPIPTPPEVVKPVGEYSTEAEAKRNCGSDPVVWANLETKVLHDSSDRYYGKTKKGAYVCQSVAIKNGMHMDKSKS